MIIINNKHFFGNEKHLKCEKIIILLEKLATYSLAFFYAIHNGYFENLPQSRINETLNRKFTFPGMTDFSTTKSFASFKEIEDLHA